MSEKDPAERYRANLQGEVDGAALYRVLPDVEADEKLAEVYRARERKPGLRRAAHFHLWPGGGPQARR